MSTLDDINAQIEALRNAGHDPADWIRLRDHVTGESPVTWKETQAALIEDGTGRRWVDVGVNTAEPRYSKFRAGAAEGFEYTLTGYGITNSQIGAMMLAALQGFLLGDGFTDSWWVGEGGSWGEQVFGPFDLEWWREAAGPELVAETENLTNYVLEEATAQLDFAWERELASAFRALDAWREERAIAEAERAAARWPMPVRPLVQEGYVG